MFSYFWDLSQANFLPEKAASGSREFRGGKFENSLAIYVFGVGKQNPVCGVALLKMYLVMSKG